MTSSVFLRASGTAGTVCPHEASRPAPAAALRPLLFILSPALHAGEHPNRHQSLGPRSRRAMASFLESRAGVLEFCVIRQTAAILSPSATDVAASDCTAELNVLHSTIFTTHASCLVPPIHRDNLTLADCCFRRFPASLLLLSPVVLDCDRDAIGPTSRLLARLLGLDISTTLCLTLPTDIVSALPTQPTSLLTDHFVSLALLG